jgi:EAL domain-containing protein (putative c-di-GMP-specific phosphodiesterase class I)
MQPAYNYGTKKIEYGEVLIRKYMNMDNVANILRYVKINQMEVVFDIDVLRETLRIMSCYDSIEYPIGVNLCSATAEKERIADRILLEIDSYDIPHENIIIEINEETDFSNPNVAENIDILRKAGIKIALDDFGIKNANLYTLMYDNIDILKIDRSFIENKTIELEKSQHEILTMVMSLCKKLNLKHIVEGIETEKQLKNIQDMGYSVVQGYLYQKPVLFNEFSLNRSDAQLGNNEEEDFR